MNELKRQYRIVDMMLSAHSLLRDRNKKRALIVDILLLVLSFIVTSMVFLDPVVVTMMQFDPNKARIVLGICAVLVFILSIISLKVDWKENAAIHDKACDMLINLKNECRDILNCVENEDAGAVKEVSQKCSTAIAGLPKLPDKKFNKLKAYHLKKIEMSKLISQYPKVPFLLLRVKLIWRGIKDFFMASMINNEHHE